MLQLRTRRIKCRHRQGTAEAEREAERERAREMERKSDFHLKCIRARPRRVFIELCRDGDIGAKL